MNRVSTEPRAVHLPAVVRSGVGASSVVGYRDASVRVMCDHGGAHPAQALGFFIGVGQNLQDEVAETASNLALAETGTCLSQMFEVQILAPLVRGGLP